MKPSPELVQAFNTQIGNELGASLQYVTIGNYFDLQALPELSRFFFRQGEEERLHAMKFVHFLGEVGAPVVIPPIPAPKSDITSAEEAVRMSLTWEEDVTEQIYGLVKVAQKDGNYIAQRFLDWFVEEQREEVATMGALLQVVKRAGEDGLLHVEQYLAREGGAAPAEAPA